MKCLHLLLSASADAVRDCTRHCEPGDRILLADGGVTLLADERRAGKLAKTCGGRISALVADARARGLVAAAERLDVNLAGDDEWVEMVAGHNPVLSWK